MPFLYAIDFWGSMASVIGQIFQFLLDAIVWGASWMLGGSFAFLNSWMGEMAAAVGWSSLAYTIDGYLGPMGTVLSVANIWFPVEEGAVILGAYVTWWSAFATVRTVKHFIPTISG